MGLLVGAARAESLRGVGAPALYWENESLRLQWRLGSDVLELRNLQTGGVVTIATGLRSLEFDTGRIEWVSGRPLQVAVEDMDQGAAWRFALPEAVSKDGSLRIRVTTTFELGRSAPWIRKKVRVVLLGPAGSPPTKGTPAGQSLLLKEVVIDALDLTGQQPRQPFGGWQSYPALSTSFFFGVEFPVATTTAKGDVVRLAYKPGARWAPGTSYDVWPAVYGVSAAGRSREVFEAYIRSLRPRSAAIHIQYNSWWSAPYPFTEKHMLDLIEAFYEKFYKPHGARLDTFCLDMGWSDRRTIWRIDERNFPLGFTNLVWALKRMDSRLGLWCSPSSCYPDAVDNDWAEQNGYETFLVGKTRRLACLAGSRYQGAYKASLVDLTRRYDIAHIKYDGYVPSCPQKDHGHEPGDLSCEKVALGLIDIFRAVHSANPDAWFEPTCFGFQPSPWWLAYANSVIGTFGDDAPVGRIPCPVYRESYTTARDFFNLQGTKDILLPICAQEVLGIIHQTTEPLQNDAVVTVLRGHSFLPLYVNPKFMDDRRWRFLARLCNWARANAELLTHTTALCFGGWADDRKSRSWEGELPRDPYGYAHFQPDRGLVLLRNPWVKPRTLSLALDESIGFPPSLKEVAPIWLYPDFGGAADRVSYGGRFEVRLAPYETKLLAFGGYAGAPSPPSSGHRDLEPPKVQSQFLKTEGSLRLTFDLPQGPRGRQLWLLYESARSISEPEVRIRVNGTPAEVQMKNSADGWRASGHKVVEHWVWVLAELPAERSTVQADSELLDDASLSAWLVATAPIPDDASPARPIPPPEIRYLDAAEILAPTTLESVGAPKLTNVALAKQGAKASASSKWAAEHEAAMAIDGNPKTRWNSGAEDKVGAWLEVDLGKPRRISQIRFLEACAGRITKYRVQVWTGSDWRDVVTAEKPASKTFVRHRIEPVETSKVRLVILEATEVPSIFELEVYAQP